MPSMAAGGDAVPTEDAMQALIDVLVAPLLPSKFSPTDTVDSDQEIAVGKQMHAVVLLYNYYHRKQFPQLESLDFESFCKLAVIARPSILTYMKFMRNCNEDFSTAEKMVMDACNICTSLDASKKAPNMESWPISKVAVFLIDSAKENCLLQNSTITQGVWSLLEKDLDTPLANLVGGQEMKKHISNKGRTASGASGVNSNVLNQLALFAKESTGIKQSNLTVLAHGITYSLSREKATTMLYIMMYKEAANREFTEVPIKDVLNSLREPLFKKDPDAEVTPTVDYYHLLPYIDIVSDYLSGKTSHDGSSDVVRPHAIVDVACLLEPARKPMMEGLDIHNKSGWGEQSASSPCNKMRKIEHATIGKKGSDPSLTGAACRPSSISGDSAMELGGLPIRGVQAIMHETSCRPPNITDASSLGILNNNKSMIQKTVDNIAGVCGSSTGDIYKTTSDSFPNHGQLLSPHKGDTGSRKNSILEAHICSRDIITNQIGAACRPSSIISDSYMKLDGPSNKEVEAIMDETLCTPPNITGDSSMGLPSKNKSMLQNVENIEGSGRSYSIGSIGAICEKGSYSSLIDKQLSPRVGGTNRTNGISEAPNFTRNIITNQVGATLVVNGFNNKAVTVDSVKELDGTECKDAEPLSSIVPCAQQTMDVRDLPLVPMQITSEDHDRFQLVMAPKKNELLHASLQILHKKLDGLVQQQHQLQEEVAQCEMNIQTLLSGGEENLKSNIELIIEACSNLCSTKMQASSSLCLEERSPLQQIKRKRLFEAVLSLQKPCQELDSICRANNWILPRYSVLPSFDNGMFQANVMIQGVDFQFTVDGDLKNNPHEARNSAAAHGLNKLRSMAAEQAQ